MYRFVVLATLAVVAPVAVAHAAPATQPSSKPGQPARIKNVGAELAAARLIEILSKNSAALSTNHQEWAIDLVLRRGDFASARKILDIDKPGREDLRALGHLCGRLPGGPAGPAARAVLKHYREDLNRVGAIEGVAIGLARAGKIKEALAWEKKLSDGGFGSLIQAELMEIRPIRTVIDAYVAKPRARISPRHAGAMLRAYIILGETDRAAALMDEMRTAQAALFKDRNAKTRISLSSLTNEAEELIFRARLYAHLSRGEFDRAVALERERFDADVAAVATSRDPRQAEFEAKHRRRLAYDAIAAGMALKGDVARARAAIAEVTKTAGPSESLHVPLAYALALENDRAAVEAPVTDALAAVRNPFQRAAAHGAVAAARWTAGDVDDAKRYAEAGLSQVAAIPGEPEQALATLHLLTGAVLGPEALLFIEQHYDAYPIRLPPK